MSSRGRTASRAGAASASRSSSSSSTSSGSASASTSSSGTSSSGAGAARSSRSSSSVSVSSPSASKTVTTTKTTTPTETTKETTAQPKTPITVSADLAKAISDSQQAYPDAWSEATGETSIQKQFEQVTGTTIPSLIIEAPEEDITILPDEEISILPEIPEAMAEQQQVLADDIVQILNDINNGVILVPDWFRNNMDWVQSGHISQQEFRTAYNYLADTQIIHAPEENLAISDNMITQKVNHFSIINGRAIGEITFTITDSFNPYYFNKNIINIIQFKTPNGINILPLVKQNTLRFTQTERDETIQYDEDMKGNTRATVESFVWDSTLSQPFSKVFMVEIQTGGDPPKPISSGFMSAGVAGAIAGLVLLGFIVDSKVGK